MAKKIIIFLAVFSLILLSKGSISLAACPAGYQNPVANVCVSNTPPPCAANETQQRLQGRNYCVLTGPPAGAPVNPAPGNIPPAQLPDSPATGFTAGPAGFVGELVSKILPIILGLGGFLTIIIIVVSGIQFVTSSGNPEAATSARGRLIMALVGFAIIILAFAITQIINTIFLFSNAV